MPRRVRPQHLPGEKCLRRPHYIALGLVGLLTLIVLNLPHHTASQIKLAIGSLFLPLFGLSKSSQHLARQAGDAMTSRSESAQAKRTNCARPTRRCNSAPCRPRPCCAKTSNCASFLAGSRKAPWKWDLRLAHVIARDPANWWQTVGIDLGSRDGMRPDLPVLTTNGLVGRISSRRRDHIAGRVDWQPQLPRRGDLRQERRGLRHHGRCGTAGKYAGDSDAVFRRGNFETRPAGDYQRHRADFSQGNTRSGKFRRSPARSSWVTRKCG